MIDCNDPSLTHYVLWKLTNTLSPPRFVISGGYFCSVNQIGVTPSNLFHAMIPYNVDSTLVNVSTYRFVSTGRGAPSAVPTHACTPIVLSLSLGIPWTCGTCVGSTGPFS